MNDFPVIGDLVMRTGLWDRQGANIASRYKEMYGVELFLRLKPVSLERMPHFAVILWEAEVTNVGALIVSFCGINAMKSIDKHSFLRKVDCEIYWMVSKYIVLTYQV